MPFKKAEPELPEENTPQLREGCALSRPARQPDYTVAFLVPLPLLDIPKPALAAKMRIAGRGVYLIDGSGEFSTSRARSDEMRAGRAAWWPAVQHDRNIQLT